MWTAPEGVPEGLLTMFPLGKRALRGVPAIAAILLVLVALAPVATHAAPAPQSAANPPASAEERSELRRTLESRYEVLPVSGGIVLKPKKARAGIRTLELTGGQVAVNGERVSTRTLRDWLGEDADAVLRLQGLSAAGQRQIFGLDDSGVSNTVVAPEPIPAPSAPPAPDVPEEPAVEEVTPDAATTDVDAAEETSDTEIPAAEPAEEEKADTSGRHNSGSRVNVGGSVHVTKDEIAEEAIAVGGSATVDGEVSRDVVAIGGPARIQGRVGGEVVAVGGGVYLGPHAVVEGNVTSVGGRIHREPGSRIEGSPSEVSFLPWNRGSSFRWDDDWEPWSFRGGVSDVMGSITWLIFMGLMTCLVLLVARVPLERVERQLTAQPWPSALTGLASAVFFWPLLLVVTVLLAITIVGCALFLLYPFLLLYLVLLGFLGYATVAYRLGRWLEIRFNRSFGGPYAAALVGVLVIQAWSVLSSILDMIPWMGFFAFMVGLFGFFTQATAWIVGFGAVVLSRFGTSPGYWPRQGPPVTVPPPPAPYTPDPYGQPAASSAGAAPVDSLPLADPMGGSGWEEPEPYPGTAGTYPPPPPEGESR